MEEIRTQELMKESIEETEETLPPLGFEVIKREFMQDKVALIALIILIAIIIVAFVSPLVLDVDNAMKVDIFNRYAKPGEDGFLLGADEGGRDILVQLLVGTRNSLIIGWSVTLIGATIGIALGVTSGYFGGLFDDILMRVIDFIMVLPTTMITIVIITIIRDFSFYKLIIILSLFAWPYRARLFRTLSLSEGSKDYINASKTLGTSNWRIIFFELLPNLSSNVITSLILSFAGNIGIETGLSFLGFGLPFDTPSLGTLISTARNSDVIENKMWVWLPAVLMILVMMLCINYVGQALQRVADSRQRLG